MRQKGKRSRTYTDVVEWFPTRAQDREVEGKNIGNRVSFEIVKSKSVRKSGKPIYLTYE